MRFKLLKAIGIGLLAVLAIVLYIVPMAYLISANNMVGYSAYIGVTLSAAFTFIAYNAMD